ncbi:O-methyltransferase [Biscogniauxia sp. FL1348]|nr:O-methyltransferase [Biscogniauxia sp. FL1348]
MDISKIQALNQALASIQAAPTTIELLRNLHTQALTEDEYLSTDTQPTSAALDRFVALDPDKCALVYLLLRATGARHVVEAGTSFGVSTIYLSLAVKQNSITQNGAGRVIATENEPTKASWARQHWASSGDELEKWIELREGDLRETLKTNLPEQIDFLLLDIWTPLALPSLRLVQPSLKVGAMIVADNVTAASEGYRDLNAYLDDPKNGFKSTVAPYSGGLRVIVYVGRTSS